MLLACDAEWLCQYEQVGGYTGDPWLAYARLHSEPILASALRLPTDVERAVVEVSARFGFRSTVIAPALSNAEQPRLGVLYLGSSTAGHFEGDPDPLLKSAVRCVAQEFHEWWSDSMRDHLIASAGLTADDLVLLRLERSGRGTKEIARAIGWTTAAIDSRFQRINARLGVATRGAAARVAAEYNLI